MLIGIDHGNYAVKTPEFEFVVGIREHSVKPPLSDEVLTYRGRHYTLTGKRISYMRDKTRDDRYFILTLFAVAKELDRMGRQNIVDIGGYTTDVLLLRSGRPDLEYCRSLETGIITMNNEIIRKVNTLHDMMLEDAHIRAVVMGEKVVLPEEIKKTICEEAGRHAGRILDQLRELQVDLRQIRLYSLAGEAWF